MAFGSFARNKVFVILGYGCGVRGLKVRDFSAGGLRPPWPRPEPSALDLRGSMSVGPKVDVFCPLCPFPATVSRPNSSGALRIVDAIRARGLASGNPACQHANRLVGKPFAAPPAPPGRRGRWAMAARCRPVGRHAVD